MVWGLNYFLEFWYRGRLFFGSEGIYLVWLNFYFLQVSGIKKVIIEVIGVCFDSRLELS